MIKLSQDKNQIYKVLSFQDLISTPFREDKNAVCWTRKLQGDFSEIVNKFELNENITVIYQEDLNALQLTDQGEIARQILIKDMKALKDLGASPILNLIKYYERDDSFPFFPTDVYSFHVDRSSIPTDTYLCTYYGDASEIIPNSQAQQKVLIPEIRNKLKKIHDGPDKDFDSFLSEYFFDLHYQANPNAKPINLGLGNLWRLAIDHPESKVLPCIHRAPREKNGQYRLMIIC